MSNMRITAHGLNRSTLGRQLLLRREALGVTDAVRRMVALQAQEAASPYLALWNRLAGFDSGDLDAAFAGREVVKATLMRITLHAVHTGAGRRGRVCRVPADTGGASCSAPKPGCSPVTEVAPRTAVENSESAALHVVTCELHVEGDRMDLLERLLEHDHWATTRLLELSRELTDAQLDQPFDIGHSTLRATLNHCVFIIDFWTGWMAGQPVRWEREVHRSIAELIERHERCYATFATFARRVHDEQRLEDTFVDHFGGRMTFGGAVLHVVLHNAEHRTEAVHILGRLGVPDLPEVDHGLWDFERRGV